MGREEWKITDLDLEKPFEASVMLTGRALEHWSKDEGLKAAEVYSSTWVVGPDS